MSQIGVWVSRELAQWTTKDSLNEGIAAIYEDLGASSIELDASVIEKPRVKKITDHKNYISLYNMRDKSPIP